MTKKNVGWCSDQGTWSRIGTKSPRWAGQVSGGVQLPWWFEPQSSYEIGIGGRMSLPETVLRYTGIWQISQLTN